MATKRKFTRGMLCVDGPKAKWPRTVVFFAGASAAPSVDSYDGWWMRGSQHVRAYEWSIAEWHEQYETPRGKPFKLPAPGKCCECDVEL